MGARLGLPGRKDLPAKSCGRQGNALLLAKSPPNEGLLLLFASRDLFELEDGRAHGQIRQDERDRSRKPGEQRATQPTHPPCWSYKSPQPFLHRCVIDHITFK
jgi:hypothetical protein